LAVFIAHGECLLSLGESQMKSFTVAEWCLLHHISRSFFYKLAGSGEAPKTFKVGQLTRISEAANNEWVAAREAATSQAA
jgi:predicted DNA-binding transcriptional regulator AlpA